MEQSSLSNTSRRNADKNLRAILLAGVGGSLVFHISAIAGVAHWWKPVVAIDEPMEITMVDVDAENPIAKPEPKSKVAPIVKVPPKVEPKPVPIVKVPVKLEPEKAPAQPIPIVKVPAQITQKPAPIVKTASALDRLIEPVPTKTANKPAPKSVEPPPKAVAPPAFPDELFKAAQPPAKTLVTPKQKVAKSPTFTTPQLETPKIATDPEPEMPISTNQSGLATNSPNRKLAASSTDTPAPTQDEDFGQVKPSKVDTPTAEIAPSNNNQRGLTGTPANSSKLAGRLTTNDPPSNTPDDNFGQVAPSKIKPPTNDEFTGDTSRNQSGLANKPTRGGKLGSRSVGNDAGGNTATDNDNDFAGVPQGNSWRGARAEPGAGLKPNSGNGNSDDAGSAKAFGLQCINRCEISGLTDLEDRDGGKDKLRIKIAIDPKGNVTSASIAKSSGNSTIDRVVINGVKQMQFSPPGKMVERVVKANILL